MNFTLQGTDPRFLYLKKRLEADGHALTPDSENVIAPPGERRGIPYYQDEIYTLENAALTAEGALELLMRRSNRSLVGMTVLVVGYGRIGSALAPMLSALGARVTVAARSPIDRAAAAARGYDSVDITQISSPYDAVVNTVPAPVLDGDYGGALCLDLASAPGGWLPGTAVLKAPGLPGLYAPKAAAHIMAQAIYRVLKEEHCHG
jgi:dipicolinate synthase subunit A